MNLSTNVSPHGLPTLRQDKPLIHPLIVRATH